MVRKDSLVIRVMTPNEHAREFVDLYNYSDEWDKQFLSAEESCDFLINGFDEGLPTSIWSDEQTLYLDFYFEGGENNNLYEGDFGSRTISIKLKNVRQFLSYVQDLRNDFTRLNVFFVPSGETVGEVYAEKYNVSDVSEDLEGVKINTFDTCFMCQGSVDDRGDGYVAMDWGPQPYVSTGLNPNLGESDCEYHSLLGVHEECVDDFVEDIRSKIDNVESSFFLDEL